MTIPTKRRYICAIILLLFGENVVPSILNPTTNVDDWALEQHVSPQEAQDGYLAAREEERLVKSTVQSVPDDVLVWVRDQYDTPRQPAPSLSGARGAAVPSLLSSEAPSFGGDTLGHRPLAAPPHPSPPDIMALYRDEDAFNSVITSVGHSKDPLSLDPFAAPQLPGFTAPRVPRGRGHRGYPGGEKGRAADVRQWDRYVEQASEATGVDADYLRAMMRAESSGDPDALSPAGALGLMQFIPSTARRYGLRVNDEVDERGDPEKAIMAGARYFADLLERYDGNHDLAVAAYNAGEGAVDKYGGKIPPYAETQTHVRRVRKYYDNFRTGKY